MVPAKRILTFAEYANLRHTTPYIVDIGENDSRLVVFGSQHSSDPMHPTFDQIEQTFLDLSPRFALHEGTPPHAEADRDVAIRRHGEAGLLRHLARRAGIATASMDLPLPDEARLLRARIGQSAALVFLVVRQLASFNRKTARLDFDGYFGDFFGLIAPALELTSIDWTLIENEHRSVLGRSLSPRQVTALETDPMHDDLPTQRIARWSNRRRDQHMLRQLLEALAQHKRVFATVGVSHAVMLEPALRAAFDQEL